MAHTITGWISGDAVESAAGQFRKFTFRIGISYYDGATSSKQWTNYTFNIFAKEGQADFYRDALKHGSIVEVSAKSLAARIGTSESGAQYPYIEAIKATVENIWNIEHINKVAAERAAKKESENNSENQGS